MAATRRSWRRAPSSRPPGWPRRRAATRLAGAARQRRAAFGSCAASSVDLVGVRLRRQRAGWIQADLGAQTAVAVPAGRAAGPREPQLPVVEREAEVLLAGAG